MCLYHEPMPHRITARYLHSVVSASSQEDLDALQKEFARAVLRCAEYEDDVKKALAVLKGYRQPLNDYLPKEFPSAYLKSLKLVNWRLSVNSYYIDLARAARPLLHSIIKNYYLPPKLQKSIEKASRFYSRSKMRFKVSLLHLDGAIKTAETYLKLVGEARDQLKVIQMAVREGKPHLSEDSTTVWKAGPFTLINTGGFSDDVMKNIQGIVEKAANLMKKAGLTKPLYGNIQITKTISRGNVLAYYVLASDDFYIRANVKPSVDTVKTVCHELAHRLHFKFLKHKDAQIEQLYNQIKSHNRWQQVNEAMLPKPGDIGTLKGKKYRVQKYDSYRKKVRIEKVDDPSWIGEAPLTTWFSMAQVDITQAPDYKGFVTTYAASHPAENFAEMTAFYALGKLPAAQKEALESILF